MLPCSLNTCVIRSWKASDVDSLTIHANNRKIWMNLRDAFPHPYTKRDARDFIRAMQDRDPETTFALAVDGEAVGSIGFVLRSDVERVSAEIGYWLAEPLWGRGITSEALVALTKYAIDTHKLTRVYALPFAWNAASCRVLEKAGLHARGAVAAQRDQGRPHHRSAPVRVRPRSAAILKPRLKPRSCGACV